MQCDHSGAWRPGAVEGVTTPIIHDDKKLIKLSCHWSKNAASNLSKLTKYAANAGLFPNIKRKVTLKIGCFQKSRGLEFEKFPLSAPSMVVPGEQSLVLFKQLSTLMSFK